MTLPRFTIAQLLGFVAVVALNAALGRGLFAWNPELLIGIAIPLLVFELAGCCLLGGRRTRRPFWSGFLLFGLVVSASFVLNVLVPVVYALTSSGTLIKTSGTPVAVLWYQYGIVASNLLRPVFEGRVSADPYAPDVVLIRALVWAVPQLVAALIGGCVAWLMARMVGNRILMRAAQEPAPGVSPRHPSGSSASLTA
jgi:hypothetical protein